MNNFRNRLALIIIAAWLGGMLCILAVDFSGFRSINSIEYLKAYSQIATPVVTLIIGYYFGTKSK
jgi:hypothetical protein